MKSLSTLLFLVLLVLLSCGSDDQVEVIDGKNEVEPPASHESGDFSILFVGNSLTYSNSLPQLVVERAKEANDLVINAHTIAYGNYAIIDHWNDGNVQKEIASGQYDYVIIQQGPSSQAFGRQVLIEYGSKFKELCESHNTELVYYMVWPSRQYYHTFDGVIKNHEDAATMNNALLAPVGQVWKRHFDITQDFSYYGSDGFHPSLKGSQVAAEVIVNTLF
ncbi:MAG: SGNH/GDSL hydrolase family protein [Cyclobacteriaceae bacterium]